MKDDKARKAYVRTAEDKLCPNEYFNAQNGYIKVCATWLKRLW